MCTAITFQTRDFYFGRTLDHDVAHGEAVTVTPRNMPLFFRQQRKLTRHYAIVGMARVEDGYPLYFDAVNETGLAIAGLNFVDYARYRTVIPKKENVASFELIPWILGQCATVREARQQLERINLTEEAFRADIPPAQLHWLVADRQEAITLEAVPEGLRIYDNPVGVLTNNPTFPEQMLRLNDFMGLSPGKPQNHFSDTLNLRPYSRGMGAMGLPGDLSSQSRFVRAAFTKLNSLCGESEEASVSQFFHILDAVSQARGCCRLGDGRNEITRYTSCCNADKGIYYYKTYDNHRITGVDLHRENLDGAELIRYPLLTMEPFRIQNA